MSPHDNDDYRERVAAAALAEELLAAEPQDPPVRTVYLPGDAPQEDPK